MPTKDLREKYGENSTEAAIKAAIREELVGGDDAINANGLLRNLLFKYRSRGWARDLAEIETAHHAISRFLNSMRAEIRQRYGIPDEEPRGRSHGA